MSEAIATAEKIAGQIPAEMFDVRKHDGTITIHNPETGNHRTFRVKTVRKGKLEGKRIVSILIGPDNTTDFQGFGFADEAGVHVWRNYCGDGKTTSQAIMVKYARMLAEPAPFLARGVKYLVAGSCRRCGRKLTVASSILSGVGPECAKK